MFTVTLDAEVDVPVNVTYETADGTKLQIDLSGEVLTLTIPGAQIMTLEPNLSGRFVIKEMRVIPFEDGRRSPQALSGAANPGGIQSLSRIVSSW